ncbi:MAG: DUF2063 domain-containing protein [Methylobacter sp.]|nr:MAG: DUF2063 domain-containing protein [Methylobacter sp.]
MSQSALRLAELQTAFQTAVLNLGPKAPAFIIDTEQASAADRFKVYTDAYRLRLVDALIVDFPALSDYLGQQGFDRMARAYIDASPSDQFSIRWFGRHLPGFLSQASPYCDRPELSELADFEWLLSESFDAPEAALAGFEEMAAIAPECWPGLKLIFHPSLRRVNLAFNTVEAWEASNEHTDLPELKKNPHLESWLVWRNDLKLLFRCLQATEAVSLDAYMQGNNFAEVCALLCEYLPEQDVVVNVAGYLQAWLRDGWIQAISE